MTAPTTRTWQFTAIGVIAGGGYAFYKKFPQNKILTYALIAGAVGFLVGSFFVTAPNPTVLTIAAPSNPSMGGTQTGT